MPLKWVQIIYLLILHARVERISLIKKDKYTRLDEKIIKNTILTIFIRIIDNIDKEPV